MIRINLTVVSHKLNIIFAVIPVRQKVRVGFIREVKYPEWLANVVVVPNIGGKW